MLPEQLPSAKHWMHYPLLLAPVPGLAPVPAPPPPEVASVPAPPEVASVPAPPEVAPVPAPPVPRSVESLPPHAAVISPNAPNEPAEAISLPCVQPASFRIGESSPRRRRWAGLAASGDDAGPNLGYASQELKSKQIIAGKYELVSILGKGGMGTVHSAIHVATRRPVALKVLRGEVCADNPELVARFEREASATGRIQSQHIVQVFDTGHDEATGVAYLAMEILEGLVLSKVLRQLGPLDPTLALRIAGQCCLGLAKAHAAGIVHRDIKPPNIFLTETDGGDRVVKILDFGIAKVLHDEFGNSDPNDLTRTGNVLGSPHYMSPEQARGRKAIDHRSDIWSLGVVLYKMLAGKTPNHEVTGFGDVIIAICSRPPTPIQSLAPWVPAAAAEVVHRALRIDPNDRFQSCTEMLEALRNAVPDGWGIPGASVKGIPAEQRAAVAERVSGMMDVPSSPSMSDHSRGSMADSYGSQAQLSIDSPAQLLVQAPGGRRKRRLAAVFGAVSLLGVAGGAAWFVGKGNHYAPAEAKPAAAPTPSAVAPPDPAPAASAAQRTVQLRVAPADVHVEVNGASVEVKDGKVELTGTPGSIHEVKLSADGRDKTEKVAISEVGSIPEELSLPAPAAPPRGGSAPRGGVSPVAAAPAKPPAGPPAAKPPMPPKPTGLKASESFE